METSGLARECLGGRYLTSDNVGGRHRVMVMPLRQSWWL